MKCSVTTINIILVHYLNKLWSKIVQENIGIVINYVRAHWNIACGGSLALSSAARAEILHDPHRLLCLCSASISQLSLEDRSALLSSSTLTRSVRWLAKLTATVASAGRWFQELSESVKYWIQTCVEETWNCSGWVKAVWGLLDREPAVVRRLIGCCETLLLTLQHVWHGNVKKRLHKTTPIHFILLHGSVIRHVTAPDTGLDQTGDNSDYHDIYKQWLKAADFVTIVKIVNINFISLIIN